MPRKKEKHGIRPKLTEGIHGIRSGTCLFRSRQNLGLLPCKYDHVYSSNLL